MNLKIILFLFTLFFVSTIQRKIQWDSIKPMEKFNKPTHISNNARITHSNMVIQSRIVGGVRASEKMFPYQAALSIDTADGTYFCGGSLITKRTIMTAAHCADGARSFDILLGSTSLAKETPGELELRTNTSKVHPGWNPETIENDIALITLNEDVSFNEYISPVLLASRSSASENIVGQEAVVSGWGKVSDFSRGITSHLRYAPVTTTERSHCELYYGRFPTNAICVSGSTFMGSCSGDSGGPLTINGTQVGIVSFGGILCQVGIPDGYTRVAPYIDFIMENSDYRPE